MGPNTYDLVSLLRDSHVDITDRELDDMLAYFLALIRVAPDGGTAEFRRRFDLMALQRNLKALGTFGYQTMTRANTVYIQYMPRTLRYARSNLEKYFALRARCTICSRATSKSSNSSPPRRTRGRGGRNGTAFPPVYTVSAVVEGFVR